MKKHVARIGRKVLAGLMAAAAVSVVSLPARAAITLTPAGVAQSFTLSTFATGFEVTNSVGPIGITYTPTNGVMVTDYLTGSVRVFAADVDNQTVANATIAAGAVYGTANAEGLTRIGTTVYSVQQTAGAVLQLNANGSLNQVIISPLAGATGVTPNPTNGHLFVSTQTAVPANNAIYDVNPVTKTATLFNNANADGMIVSVDGNTLYAVVNGGGANNVHVLGYNTSTKAQVFDSGVIAGGPDGIALGGGSLFGNLFVNTNSGQIFEVNLASPGSPTLIATGGTRGDFAQADPNGTLLLTQSDNVVRLSLATGNFSGQPAAASVPLPPAVWSALVTLLCVGAVIKFRRAQLA